MQTVDYDINLNEYTFIIFQIGQTDLLYLVEIYRFQSIDNSGALIWINCLNIIHDLVHCRFIV